MSSRRPQPVRADTAAQEIGLAHGGVVEEQVGGWILQQQTRAQLLLDEVDVIADPLQGCYVVRKGQEVVEKGAAVARPGEMLGKQCRLIAFDQAPEPIQMNFANRTRAADRQPDTVQR